MEQSISEKKYLFSNRDLVNLIIPLIMEQFLAIFVGLVDSIMVASVGERAVSAVSLVDSVMVLMINIFTGLTVGGGIVVGQAIGRKHKEDGCEAIEQTLLFSFVFSLILTGMVYFGRWFILHVIFGKIEPLVMQNCSIYLNIVTASIPFLAVYNAGAAMHRSMGDSKTPMVMSLIMNGMNMVGNAVLIYGLHMGVEGAAIPTFVSRGFAGTWMLFLMMDRKKTVYVRNLKELRFKLPVLKKILYLGVPSSLENSIFQLGKLLVLSLVSTFGTVSIAANAVSNSVACFEILGGSSIGMAISAVVAQCVGAGDYEQVRYYTKKLMKGAYMAIAVCNIGVLLALPLILKIYNLSPETADLTRKIVLYHTATCIIAWAPSFALPNTLRASNDVGFCMWLSILSMWICRIAFSYVLAKYLGFGVLGVWIAMSLDWVVRSFFFIRRYRGHKWELKKV